MGPPGHRAGAIAPPPLPFLRRCSSAPLRVVRSVDEHCLPQEGECLCPTTYSDCRCCPFSWPSSSRCPRAGPAGPLRWGRCPAALAVLLPLPLRSTAGGRRQTLPAPRWGVSPFDHVPRLSSLSIRRDEPAPLPPGRVRWATALGQLPRRSRRSSAAAAPLHCGWSSTGTACPKVTVPGRWADAPQLCCLGSGRGRDGSLQCDLVIELF